MNVSKLAAGGALAVTGAVLIAAARAVRDDLSLPAIAAALAAGGAIELVAGWSARRHANDEVSALRGGAFTLAFVAIATAMGLFDARLLAAGPWLMLFSAFLASNATLRIVDLAFRHRPFGPATVAGIAALFAAAGLAGTRWPGATAGTFALVTGLALVGSGVALAGTGKVVSASRSGGPRSLPPAGSSP